ncbi:MAG: DUF3326 domain-containing protein [Alphaproteobacteria bacterium]|nr:DUF3326 domain-containing protein [Alphaproteobacteria bacterium]
MDVSTVEFQLPSLALDGGFDGLRLEVEERCGAGRIPLRFASVRTTPTGFVCEVEAITDPPAQVQEFPSIFQFRQRSGARGGSFNAVMIIPTGVDCAIGGHAGDATPAAKVLGAVCDTLVLHPNVVNASDINEQPANALYVEGSLICRLMMGSIGLRTVRRNRVLLVTEARDDGDKVLDQVVNCVSGARATLGLDCPRVVVLAEGLEMQMAYATSGRATGRIGKLEGLVELLVSQRDRYDAVALATRITSEMDSVELNLAYYHGEGANPWGGVEAALTHALSTVLDVPTAHAPTLCHLGLLTAEFGQAEPRKAAEAISETFLFCVLKGLHNAPRVIPPRDFHQPGELHAEDLDVLVTPDGCIGLPVLAALVQGMTVIAVTENTNLMRNDLDRLPWAPGQLIRVRSYFEAAGVLAAMKAGVDLTALDRPMALTRVELT